MNKSKRGIKARKQSFTSIRDENSKASNNEHIHINETKYNYNNNNKRRNSAKNC